jgi:hypothetical protein
MLAMLEELHWLLRIRWLRMVSIRHVGGAPLAPANQVAPNGKYSFFGDDIITYFK